LRAGVSRNPGCDGYWDLCAVWDLIRGAYTTPRAPGKLAATNTASANMGTNSLGGQTHDIMFGQLGEHKVGG